MFNEIEKGQVHSDERKHIFQSINRQSVELPSQEIAVVKS